MSKHWRNQAEGGGRLAYAVIRTLALYGGRRLSGWALYPVTLYFFLRRAEERRASRDYLQRLWRRPVRRREVLRHFHCFANAMLDRIFLLVRGEQAMQVEIEGVQALEQDIDRGRGVLLLGTHHGSFDALRAIAGRRPDIPLRVVLDKQKTPAMTAMLEALAPAFAAQVIDASQGGTSVTLAMAETCQQGGMVALLADRGRDQEATRLAPFLGSPAPFPVGPWLLAHSLKVPVVLCIGLYQGPGRYRLVFEPLAEQVVVPRHARQQALDQWIGRYAARLEHYVRQAPMNWFNFYPFWQQPVVPLSRGSSRRPRLDEVEA